jgi:hypothetical protein
MRGYSNIMARESAGRNIFRSALMASVRRAAQRKGRPGARRLHVSRFALDQGLESPLKVDRLRTHEKRAALRGIRNSRGFLAASRLIFAEWGQVLVPQTGGKRKS